jgi:predicted TIM-barrel fold metal-dependent hydrolase
VIVDVDTHWEVQGFAAGTDPLGPWADRIPKGIDRLAFAIAGDLLADLPEPRPTGEQLLPGLVQAAEAKGGPVILHPLHQSTAAERVAWMDEIGVDHALVNPGGYWQGLEFLGTDRPAGVRRCNDFLAEALSDHADRLHLVAIVDLTEPQVAVAELERARACGSRAFFLYTEHGRPPGGRSPGHPAYDVVYEAAVRLGMIAVIHVGNTASDFAGWADIGWDQPNSSGVAGLVRLANSQRHLVAQQILAGLLYGGVFARHPQLTVLCAEVRTDWIPGFRAIMERQARSSFATGDWPYERSAAEMFHDQLRVTPLPGFGDDVLGTLAVVPDLTVFSSDYPHQEGNADPLGILRPGLDELDDDLRRSFLGANMEACFARTGDPLA